MEPFRLDRPLLDAFPFDAWNRLAASWLSRTGPPAGFGDPLGFPPLRAAIAKFMGDTRGVRCTADQVVVTSGTQESLDLIAKLLLDPGDRVWMEDPGYAAVTSLLRAHRSEVIAVPVDSEGLDCDLARRRCEPARLAYVTPTCQFPLGISMSLERRQKLLQWANETGAWIFEDDYDGQLQFDDRSATPLYSLDRESSVIYANSFNRMLFPWLRLGFLILPPALAKCASTALSITRRYGSLFEQAVLADFIMEGHLELHVQRMREIYAAGREALVRVGTAELAGLMEFGTPQCGLQIIGWLAPGLSETEVSRRAAARRIYCVPLSSLTMKWRMPPGLVFGICGTDVRGIKTAIKRLGQLLRALAWQKMGSAGIHRNVVICRGL